MELFPQVPDERELVKARLMAEKSKQMQQARSAANLQKLQQQAGSEEAVATVLQMNAGGHTSWLSFTPVTLVFKDLRSVSLSLSRGMLHVGIACFRRSWSGISSCLDSSAFDSFGA
jgi:hypothetical protein